MLPLLLEIFRRIFEEKLVFLEKQLFLGRV